MSIVFLLSSFIQQEEVALHSNPILCVFFLVSSKLHRASSIVGQRLKSEKAELVFVSAWKHNTRFRDIVIWVRATNILYQTIFPSHFLIYFYGRATLVKSVWTSFYNWIIVRFHSITQRNWSIFCWETQPRCRIESTYFDVSNLLKLCWQKQTESSSEEKPKNKFQKYVPGALYKLVVYTNFWSLTRFSSF